MASIGIRHEDKYLLERRSPLIPSHIERLVKEEGIEVFVQSSEKRIFADEKYQNAGASIVKNLKDADVIFGVKEMPLDFFEPNKTYVFFAHVIKSQPYNMPMLKKMMDLGCNLIDYERVVNEANQRLIFFGRYAGLAGMINSLWSLGQRCNALGIANPFSNLKQAHKYPKLEIIQEEIKLIAHDIRTNGLPDELCPLTIGFTGYGNVSKGAQEIAHLLPVTEISPEELLNISQHADKYSNKKIYISVFKEGHLSQPNDNKAHFDLADYYINPQNYHNVFEQYIPNLTILMNCMYWNEHYPRIVTKDYLEKLYQKGEPKLKVIGDITCDPDGSIECLHKGTEIEDPVFVYNPIKRNYKMGFEGLGILVMAVDILPSELPRTSSKGFSTALMPFVYDIAHADYSKPFDDLALPYPIKRALILHKGKLTDEYKYINLNH